MKFKPTDGEIRICRLVKSGCTDRKLTFQDAFNGELFISEGNEHYNNRRKLYIDDVVNKMGTFITQFDVHKASTTFEVDANHFAKTPAMESI